MLSPYNRSIHIQTPQRGFPGFQGDPINCVLEPTAEDGGLFIGDIESVTNPYILQSHQIGAIITVSRELSHITFPQNVNHLVLPIDDSHSIDISQFFAQAIDFISTNRKFTNVLVHCRVGASRSATLVLAYLMKEYGMHLNESFSFLKEKRWKIQPNHGFMNQLRQFERFLFHRRRTNSIGGVPIASEFNLAMSIASGGIGIGYNGYQNWY